MSNDISESQTLEQSAPVENTIAILKWNFSTSKMDTSGKSDLLISLIWSESIRSAIFKNHSQEPSQLIITIILSQKMEKIQSTHRVFKISPYVVMPCPSWISLFLDTRITHTLAGNLYLIGTHMEYWPDVVLHYVGSLQGKIAENKKRHFCISSW